MDYQYDFFQDLENSVKMDTAPQGASIEEDKCPVCNEDIVRNGRCKTCYSCGWSSCDL